MSRKGLIALVVMVVIISGLIIGGWQLFSKNKIIGEWTGTDKTGNSASFTFHKDGTGTMLSRNITLNFNYELFSSKNPFWLDLDIKLPNRDLKMKFIGRYKDENNLQLYTYFDENRPKEFPNSNEGIMNLKRVK